MLSGGGTDDVRYERLQSQLWDALIADAGGCRGVPRSACFWGCRLAKLSHPVPGGLVPEIEVPGALDDQVIAAQERAADDAPVQAQASVVTWREADRAGVDDVTVPFGRDLAGGEEHEVAVDPALELGVVVAQQPVRRIPAQPCYNLSLELVDRGVVHLRAQVAKEADRRHVMGFAQRGRAWHHEPVPAAGPGKGDHLHRRPSARPGFCLEPQAPDHPAHDAGVGQRALGIGEGTARRPFPRLEHVAMLHGSTLRPASSEDQVRETTLRNRGHRDQ